MSRRGESRGCNVQQPLSISASPFPARNPLRSVSPFLGWRVPGGGASPPPGAASTLPPCDSLAASSLCALALVASPWDWGSPFALPSSPRGSRAAGTCLGSMSESARRFRTRLSIAVASTSDGLRSLLGGPLHPVRYRLQPARWTSLKRPRSTGALREARMECSSRYGHHSCWLRAPPLG